MGDMVEFGWDEQLVKCAEKIRGLKFKPNSIFNRISVENKFDGFPEDFEKLTLSPALRAEIFAKFKFKNLTLKSSAAAIVKNIYNAEFGFIYVSEKTSKTHQKTVLKPLLNEYFAFVYANIRDKVIDSTLCQCGECVLTPVCGRLLCGTCGMFALEERSEPEETDPEAEYFHKVETPI
jgi:hypothetical protein